MRDEIKKLGHIYVESVNESNISRIYQHILEHDCACISASKDVLENCLFTCNFPNGHTLTRQQNGDRNADLRSTLLESGYGVTRIDGSWIEGYGTASPNEYKEESYFVVNLRNAPDFAQKIIDLGKFYCQDTVLIKAQGVEEAYLYGTNNHPHNTEIPDLDQKKSVGLFRGGETAPFMSRIRNRPFKFEIRENLDFMTRGYGTFPSAQKVLGKVKEMLDFLQGKGKK
jgi:hypothetical protein